MEPQTEATPEVEKKVEQAAAPEAAEPTPAADEPKTEPTVHTYIVSTRTEREDIVGRQPAVDRAKALTADGTSVQVERADGRVRMQFRDGSLVEYVYETRKGRTV